MNLTSDTLLRQWKDISYKDGGFLQINIQHPLEWHIGYQSINRKTLLLVYTIEIDNFESSKSMLVKHRRREIDNRLTLTFELLRDAQQDVFSIFCADLIMYSYFAKNEQAALDLVISRYKQWIRLLESQNNGFMDEHICKGLLGELLFLEIYMDTHDSDLISVEGWSGAEAADQDFMYSEGWYEVKSIGISASTVNISSLEQLDSKETGELIIMRIDKTAPTRINAISLNDVVHRIKKKLSLNPLALELFDQKLISYGYIDLNEYSKIKYLYSGMHRYDVNDSFPKIISNNIPTEVISLKYSLSLPTLNNWLKG